MKSFLAFTLTFTLLLGCASNTSRDIANDIDVPLTYAELMTFNSTSLIEEDFNAATDESLKTSYETQFEKRKLASNEAFKLDGGFKNNKFILTVIHSDETIKDRGAGQELKEFILQGRRNIRTQQGLIELLYNAKEGDLSSLVVLARFRKNAAEINLNYNVQNNIVSPDFNERLQYWTDKVKEFEKAERAQERSFKKIKDQRKALMDKLDKAPDEQQLKTLIAKNDREGVVKLLRSYLPWEMMPPFEKAYWENQLAVMADPLPIEKRIFIYRGINDDMIHSPIVDGIELSKEQALRDQKIFLMSSILTKNQGSWNRRLRSLTAMYDKFIATNNKDNTFTKTARITTMFNNHAATPKGSPFLSFTPDYSVADGFGKKRKTLYFLDPRAIQNNNVGLIDEAEFLLPLITFPDELGSVYDKEIHANFENSEATMRRFAMENLDREYGNGKGGVLFKQIEINSKAFFSSLDEKRILKTNSVFLKTTLGKNSAQVAKKITPEAKMQCMNIIQLFWK